jgi:C1A family cysteine protease
LRHITKNRRNIMATLIPRKHIYGWKADTPDFKDRMFSMVRKPLQALPPKVDLREFCGPILNQGNLGSCTAHALAADYMFQERKQQKPDMFLPSRLFIYWNERYLENSVDSDSGAMIRDGIKVLNKIGVCQEKLWGYDKDFRKKPTPAAFLDAKKRTISQYLRIDGLDDLRSCLANGNPVVFGFSVYESFESATVERTGIVPMPSFDEAALGGHAVLAVGYDDAVRRIIVQNSWGADWGDKGFFYLPYGYILDRNLSDDFWTIVHVA